jgi:spore coat protein U-like protein
MAFSKTKYLAVLAVIAFSGLVLAGSVMAATVTPAPTVAVTGSVSGACRAGVAGSLSFTIDPSVAGPVAASISDATVFCSNGTPFTVTAASLNQGGPAANCASSGAGVTGTLKDGVNTMDYTFKCGVDGTANNIGTGKGHGIGKDLTLGISGLISSADYQNAPVSPGYADTITLTITY